MPKISEILGQEKFDELIANGVTDDEITALAKKERKRQLAEQGNTRPPISNPILEKDNAFTQTVRGLADTGFRIGKALDYAAESVGFDLLSDESTEYINNEQAKIENAKKRVSQKGLSTERLEELKNLENQSANANGTWENVKAGVNQMVDMAIHPSEWTTQGVVETLVDPLNVVSFGAGGIAAKTTKTFLGKLGVGTAAGATEGAVVNSAYEYAVAKGGKASDEEAKKIAVQSAAGGAAAGATFGAVGGASFKDKKTAAVKNKTTKDILDNDLLKLNDQGEAIDTKTSRPTSSMSVAREILKDVPDNESKTKALDAVTNEDIYKNLPKELRSKVDQLREYEAYQEALNPNKEKAPTPLQEFEQKILSSQEVKQRIDDAVKVMPEIKKEDAAQIDQKYHDIQKSYDQENINSKTIEDQTPDFKLVHEKLPAVLNELIEVELIDEVAAKQIEYKHKTLQLQNKGVIYANFEGWSESVGQHVIDAINAKKINEFKTVELESSAALEGIVKLQDELINEGATPGQIKEIANRRFIPTKLEADISNVVNDGQPIENRYAGFRIRELTDRTIENLENPDINDLKIKLENANVQTDLQKAVLDSIVNKDINILDDFMAEKVTGGAKELSDNLLLQFQDNLAAAFKSEDSVYQTNLDQAAKQEFETYKFHEYPKEFVIEDLRNNINNFIESTPGTKEFLSDVDQVEKIGSLAAKFDDHTLAKYMPEEKTKVDLIRAVEAVEALNGSQKVANMKKFDDVVTMLEEGC